MSVVIRVSSETRELLKRTAAKDQTYDDIIRESLELYNALMSELDGALHDPDSEWTKHDVLLKELGISDKEIERERKKLGYGG
jgi:mevalonate kinase